MGAVTNYFRRKHARAFMKAMGVLDTDRDGLQRLVEDGSLLSTHNLNTSQNLNRYHRVSPQLLGTDVAAPDPTVNVDHFRVDPIDETLGVVPRSDLVGMLKKYVGGGFREFFFHEDKKREVAKGLGDLYKEYQRIQATEGRRLTVQEAAAIIDQRRYTATRSALEQLAVDLEYVGTTTPTTPYTPYAPYPYGAVSALVLPTADEIHRASRVKGLAKLPDWIHGLAQEGIPLALATLNPLGFLAGYGTFKGAQLISGAVSNYISNRVRAAGATYAKIEDGWENEAQLVSRLTSLGTFGTLMTATTGALGFGLTTGIIAGSAVANYMAGKRRQIARSGRYAFENLLQQGLNNPALENTINYNIGNAVFYEKVSRGLDLLAFASMGAGLAYGFYDQGSFSKLGDSIGDGISKAYDNLKDSLAGLFGGDSQQPQPTPSPTPGQQPLPGPSSSSTSSGGSSTGCDSLAELVTHGEWADTETNVTYSYNQLRDANWFGIQSVTLDGTDGINVHLNSTLAGNTDLMRFLVDSNHDGSIGEGDSSYFVNINNGNAHLDTNGKYDFTTTRFQVGAIDLDTVSSNACNIPADINLKYLSSIDSQYLHVGAGSVGHGGHSGAPAGGVALPPVVDAGTSLAIPPVMAPPAFQPGYESLYFFVSIDDNRAEWIDKVTVNDAPYMITGRHVPGTPYHTMNAQFNNNVLADFNAYQLYLDGTPIHGTDIHRSIDNYGDTLELGKASQFQPRIFKMTPGYYDVAFVGDIDGNWQTTDDQIWQRVFMEYHRALEPRAPSVSIMPPNPAAYL